MRRSVIVSAGAALWIASATGQPANPRPGVDPSTPARQAIALVETGHCKEALPVLERAIPHLTDKQLRYHAGMAEARCAMALDRESTALEALLQLKREFPNDPEVLYVTTHYFSELAMRTSQELAAKAPTSYQARRLEAEAFESHGKWNEAAGIYRGILAQNPRVPGIHYRLGQVLLSKAGNAEPTDEAKAQFRLELQLDPNNAAAEFVLGELARRSGQWDEAAHHFSRAKDLDVGFSEAYLALGMSLAAESKFAEALPSLQRYVEMQPADPAGHYQLAIAYARTGNKAGAEREMARQKQIATHAQRPPDTTEGHAAVH